jgi:(2Fe-2S) ferredoxin
MQTREKALLAQFFVCTHERSAGESCAQSGSLDVFQKLKNRSKTDPAWQGKVSITKSGCLGFCSEGIASVIYPHRKWLTGIKPGDEEKVAEWIDLQIDPEHDGFTSKS